MSDTHAHLRRLAQGLPVPDNFYRGASLPWTGLPKDVLLFWRQSLGKRHADIHHRFVLILALDGQGTVVVDEKLHQLGPGKALLVFPFQRHYYADVAHRSIAWLFVGFEFDDPAPLAVLRDRVFPVEKTDDPLLVELVSAFHGALRNEEAGTHAVSLWLSLLLIRLKGRTRRIAKATWAMTHLQATIQRVAHYVAHNVNRPMRLDAIAQAAGISKSHLQRLCRQTMAVSLGQYVRHARMNEACSRLHSSEANVTEIAAACGFSSVYAFSRAFRTEIGLSPLKYRRQFRDKPSAKGKTTRARR